MFKYTAANFRRSVSDVCVQSVLLMRRFSVTLLRLDAVEKSLQSTFFETKLNASNASLRTNRMEW